MNPPTTRLKQLPLLLESEKSDALEELARELDMPKQELLREAVDDLLAMHNTGVRSLTVEILRNALRQSAEIVLRLEQLSKREALWKRKCYDAKLAINDALNELGVENPF